MCGIIGFSSKEEYNLDKIIQLSLCNSYERGGDATGFFTPNSGIVKATKNFQKFLLSEEIGKVQKDNILIGHFRKMSVGSNNVKNAHPFEEDNIVMCHNGTLTQYYQLATQYDLKHSDWDTDSQILSKAISKDLHEQGSNAFLNVFDSYTGAAAVLYYDKLTEQLFAYRDCLRPLHYGMLDGSMYISSLDYALEIIGCTDIKEFEENTIHVIKEGAIVKEIKKPVTVKYLKIAKKEDLKTSWDYKRQVNVSRLPDGTYTGFKSVFDIDLKNIVGFNLKYLGSTSRAREGATQYAASLTKNKHYEVVGVDSSYSSRYIKIEDDDGNLKLCAVGFFDTHNFLPVVGRYIKIISKLFSDNELVMDENDYVQVVAYTFGDTKLSVKIEDNRRFTISLCDFVTLSEKEHAAVIESLKNKKKGEDKNNENEKTKNDCCSIIPINQSNNIQDNNQNQTPNNQVNGASVHFQTLGEIVEDDAIFRDDDDDEDEDEEREIFDIGTDANDWMPVNDLSNYSDILYKKIENIIKAYHIGTDITHHLDDLQDLVVDAVDYEGLQSVIENNKNLL